MSYKSILQHVYETEQQQPNKTWLTQPLVGGKVVEYTWAEALQEARKMAQYLIDQDYDSGSKIAMVSKNCASFVIAELAIWMAGHTTVALYPTINEETGSYILEHSEAKLIFVGKLDTWDEIQRAIPADMPKIAMPQAPKTDFTKWEDIMSSTKPLEGNPDREEKDLALILYTSGSTGRPKGVMHGFGPISDVARRMVKTLSITGQDRMLSYLPLAHVFERSCVDFTSLVGRSHLFFAESLDTFVQDLNRCKPTLFVSVPRLWLKFQLGVLKKMPQSRLNLLLKIPVVRGLIKKKILTGLGLDQVRFAVSGSAPVPAELIEWYRSLGLNLYEGYAMSEDLAYSHLSKPGYAAAGYVGVPLDGVQVKLSDAGEILINSPGKMFGYYKAEDLTKDSFTEDGFFKTGDRGHREENGMLKITGRVKEIFKTSKGKYISPAPIENIINNDENIELSCVSGLGYPQPYAQVQLAEDIRNNLTDAKKSEVTQALNELLNLVNSRVEHHERLQFIAVTAEEWTASNGCLTPTMKIRRSAIEDVTKGKLDGWYDSSDKVIWS